MASNNGQHTHICYRGSIAQEGRLTFGAGGGGIGSFRLEGLYQHIPQLPALDIFA